MFKIEIKKKESTALIGAIFNGLSALNIPKDTYIQVIDAKADKNSIGSILIKLDNERHPFRTIQEINHDDDEFFKKYDNGLWGNGVENYSFKVIAYIEKKE